MSRMMGRCVLFGCLLVLVTSLILWVGSYARGIQVGVTVHTPSSSSSTNYAERYTSLEATNGSVHFASGGFDWPVDYVKSVSPKIVCGRPYFRGEIRPEPSENSLQPFIGTWSYESRELGCFMLHRFDIRFPIWSVVLAALLFPVIQWRRPKRRHPHGCLSCGYNLTGNGSGICPECGQAVPNSHANQLKPAMS